MCGVFSFQTGRLRQSEPDDAVSPAVGVGRQPRPGLAAPYNQVDVKLDGLWDGRVRFPTNTSDLLSNVFFKCRLYCSILKYNLNII